jgi:Tol biopolymer transport system component
MNADGTGRTTPGTPASDQLGSGGGRLAWSPDGKWLAFAPVEKIGSGQPSRLAASLWRIAADGSGAIELANAGKPSDHGFIVAGGPPAQLGPSGAPWAVPSDGGMLVHPDWLAVGPPASGGSGQVAVIFGTGRETWTDKRLGLVNPVSGQVTWLTATGMAASSPNWSPDGNFAAYAAMADAGNLGGGDPARQALMGRRIYIVNTVGTAQPRQLTRDAGYRDEHPAWSADGQQILFARLEATGGASLWLVPVVGGQPRLVLGGLDPALAGGWLGYYGHVNWESMYDWWSGDKGRTAP